MYSQDSNGRFPDSMIELYPQYVSTLGTFRCPVTNDTPQPAVTPENVNLWYKYIPGLTENDNLDSLVAYDRKGNHPDDRNALFKSGHVKRIFERDWRWEE